MPFGDSSRKDNVVDGAIMLKGKGKAVEMAYIKNTDSQANSVLSPCSVPTDQNIYTYDSQQTAQTSPLGHDGSATMYCSEFGKHHQYTML
jgi:hypothetical protein